MLVDNHGRTINYLRLAVTDRCNLRCFYCMPENGIEYVPKAELMTYEEMIKLIEIFSSLGITKIRITGGEPFVRKGMFNFIEQVSQVKGVEQLHITTNGVLSAKHIPNFKKIGIQSVNLSLDSLDKTRFLKITRRDEFDKVMQSLNLLIENEIPTKINCVAMVNKNEADILPLVALTKEKDIAVRFIEEMPFNGIGKRNEAKTWTYKDILSHIKTAHPNIVKIEDPQFSTSLNYKIPNHQGTIGLIPAYSRTFCGTCNRLRLTAVGDVKTCLYDNGVFNIKDLLRKGLDNEAIKNSILKAIGNRAKDGFEAENARKIKNPISESMSTIGG